MMHEQGLDDIVVEPAAARPAAADLSEWEAIVKAKQNPEAEVDIAMVGKYVDLKDSYISLSEALLHGGIHTRTRVNIHYVEAQDIEKSGTRLPRRHGRHCRARADSVTAASRARSRPCSYARENGIPYLGICLGMQVAVIEAARHLAGLEGAMSTEFNRPRHRIPVVGLITEWQTIAAATSNSVTSNPTSAARCAWAPST